MTLPRRAIGLLMLFAGSCTSVEQSVLPSPIQMPPQFSRDWSEASQFGKASLLDVAFADASTGWVVNGYDVFETADGGYTWRAIAGIPEIRKLRSVSLRDSSTLFVIGGDFNPEEISPQRILKSADAGRTWAECAAMNVIFPFRLIRWGTPLRGYVRGAPDLLTRDGGDTWRAINSDRVGVLLLIGSTEGWGGTKHRVFHTRDDCESWQELASVEALMLWQDEEMIDEIVAADSRNLWIVGTLGTLLRSEDGGTSWKIETRFPRKWEIRDLCFVTPTQGWAILRNAAHLESMVVHTEDAGRTWMREYEYRGQLNRLHFRNENSGWAVGEVVLRYERRR